MRRSLISVLALVFVWSTGCSDPAPATKNGFVTAGQFKVYYERSGKGQPILLLHAGLQDHSMWDGQVSELSREYEVLTIDLPFHGQTTGVDTTLLAAEVVRIVLDSLHLQKISIAGLSMGSYAAQDFIIAHPERVNKGILISSGVNGYDEAYTIDSINMAWYPRFSNALKEHDTIAAAKEFTRAWAEGIYRSGDSLKSPASQQVFTKTLETLKLHKLEGWPALQSNPPAVKSLSSINVPILVLNGDKDLPFITASSLYLAKQIRNARHVVLPGVAHMLNLENQKETNHLILDFLKAP